MTILIGYVPTPAGEAALEAGLAEAARSGDDVVVAQQPPPRRHRQRRPGQRRRRRGAGRPERPRAGVTARVNQADHGSDIVNTFQSQVDDTGARLVVLGLRRR